MPKTAAVSRPIGGSAERQDLPTRVRSILGLAGLRGDLDLVSAVERRLPIRAIDALRLLGLGDDEIHGLIVPRRTLTHRRSRREALSTDESDRVVRVVRVIVLAEEVFGDPARARRWLHDPKRRLNGRTPLALLATEAGARVVEEWLRRLDDGMAA